MEEENEDERWMDSGPYCEHWAAPWECEEVCAACGETCGNHDYNEAKGCDEFKNTP